MPLVAGCKSTYSKIEFCDLFKDDRSMIHVKRYCGSATLSHLFAQGAVSGQLFRSDAQFREKLNNKLPIGHKLTNPTINPQAENFDVVFAIVTDKKLPEELPFFSKVTLKNAYTLLSALGYNVSITQIKPDPAVVKKLNCKATTQVKLPTAA
jgi:uncharacterized protein (TIGR04141 family)